MRPRGRRGTRERGGKPARKGPGRGDRAARKRRKPTPPAVAALPSLNGASFRELVARAVAGVYVSTPDGRLLYCNDALARIMGYESAEAIRAAGALELYWDPGDRDRWRRELERGGHVENYQQTLRRRDGRLLHVLENARVVRGPDGEPLAYEGSVIDVTERVEAVAEATRLKNHLEAIADSTVEGLLAVVYTEDGPVVSYANRKFGEIFGLDPRSVVGRRDEEIRAQAAHCFKDPEAWERGVQELYRERERADLTELELLEPEPRILERYSGPIVGAGGEVVGRIWAFRDVTGSRDLEHQLRHAQKLEALGGLAAGVAHDFNNVLGGILSLTQSALEEVEPESPLRKLLEQVSQVARRGGSLTRQLLAFARQVEPGLQPLDLNEQVAETREFLARSIGTEVQLELHLERGLPSVMADPAQFQQILVNLCLNARDAMPKGGTIRIRTREAIRAPSVLEARGRHRRYALLEVEDEGVGIPAEHLERIFEPFFTTKPPGQGTGLGLAVVYGILERHEGYIEVESRVGCGSTFRVYLPLALPPEAP